MLDQVHQDRRQIAAQCPHWLALAEQVQQRLTTDIAVGDSFETAKDIAVLASYGEEELQARFPGWEITWKLDVVDHLGARALAVLAVLDLLVSAPDLALELLTRARDDLRAALLDGVPVWEEGGDHD